MAIRSWMTVALAASVLATDALPSDEAPPVQNPVRLQLQITGLGEGGCLLKIAPAHPGCQFGEIPDDLTHPDVQKILCGEERCRFAPIERRVDSKGVSGGMILFKPITLLAQSRGADRDCSFAITITEPGLPSRTYHRGLRLVPPRDGKTPEVQTLRLFLTAPSIALRDDGTKTKR